MKDGEETEICRKALFICLFASEIIIRNPPIIVEVFATELTITLLLLSHSYYSDVTIGLWFHSWTWRLLHAIAEIIVTRVKTAAKQKQQGHQRAANPSSSVANYQAVEPTQFTGYAKVNT